MSPFPLGFQMRDDWKQLVHAYESKLATTKSRRKEILDKHGVRHSVLNDLPGWLPARRSPIDFMHNFYGITLLQAHPWLTYVHHQLQHLSNGSYSMSLLQDTF